MRVYMFKPRFAALVASGVKRMTIRPRRSRATRVGDVLSLRRWEDKPYRSKQVVLRSATCTETHTLSMFRPIVGTGIGCYIDGIALEAGIDRFGTWDLLAREDGFVDAGEMLAWFKAEHGLPFVGDLIKW